MPQRPASTAPRFTRAESNDVPACLSGRSKSGVISTAVQKAAVFYFSPSLAKAISDLIIIIREHYRR
jgi:hypothetical protein